MKRLILLFAVAVGVPAFGAGDPPQNLSTAEAQAYLLKFKGVLTVPGCPGNQSAISGVVNGGASPVGGSQTIELKLSAGGLIKIVTRWAEPINGENYSKTSTSVECSL
jgi:hypothetical protein